MIAYLWGLFPHIKDVGEIPMRSPPTETPNTRVGKVGVCDQCLGIAQKR